MGVGLLNSGFSNGFEKWENGSIDGLFYVLDSGKAKASSDASGFTQKIYKAQQEFILRNPVLSAALTVGAAWQASGSYQSVRKRHESSGMGSQNYKLYVFDGKLCAVDVIDNDNSKVIYSTDYGDNWSDLCSMAVGGNGKGRGLITFEEDLWISHRTDGNPAPRICQWDGNSVTNHLTAISNYGAYDMEVHDDKLWVVTYDTPMVNDRWIVYTLEAGVGWSELQNYDGAEYIASNKNGQPHFALLHRSARLFKRSTENILYFIVSVYNAGDSDWTWQVWKWTGTIFTKIYDSSDDNELYSLSAVWEGTDGTVYVVGSKLDANGESTTTNQERLYSSTDMETWVAEGSINLGFPFEEQVFNGIHYLYCHWQDENYMKLWRFNEGDKTFTLVETITTETSSALQRGGGLGVYEKYLFSGKWKEVYRHLFAGEVEFEVNIIKPSGTRVNVKTVLKKGLTGSGNILSAEDISASLDEYGLYLYEIVCKATSYKANGGYTQSFGWYDENDLEIAVKKSKTIFEAGFSMGEKMVTQLGLKTLTESMSLKELPLVKTKITGTPNIWEDTEKVTTHWIKEQVQIK